MREGSLPEGGTNVVALGSGSEPVSNDPDNDNRVETEEVLHTGRAG